MVTALILAFGSACGGSYSTGAVGPYVVTDAGFGGVGPVGGGGCAGGAIANAVIIDGCSGSGQIPATVIFNACQASISFSTTSSPCTGTVTGNFNFFSGKCTGLSNCATTIDSNGLPGKFVCTKSDSTSCIMQVCAGGC